MTVEIVPTEIEHVPSGATRLDQAIAILIGSVAVIAALIAMLDADSARRRVAEATSASELAARITAERISQQVFLDAFGSDIAASTSLLLHELGAKLAPAPPSRYAAIASALEGAERRARNAETAALDSKIAPLRVPATVDPQTRETFRLASSNLKNLFVKHPQPSDANLIRQERAAEIQSQRFAHRETRAIFALSLAATAAALLGLASLFGARRPRLLIVTVSIITIIAAAGTAASAIAL